MSERCPQTPLAIIGLACRLPGANNLDEFWQLLADGRSAAGEVPPERLNQALYYSPERGTRGKTYSKVAALVDYRPLDLERCPLPGRSLAAADLGQWTICGVAAEACRHAGMNPFDLPLRNVGVYVGHTLGGRLAADLAYATCIEEAAQYLRELPAFQGLAGDRADAIIAEVVQTIRNRLPRRSRDGLPLAMAHLASTMISESLGLSGPSLVLDAACASSLQGLALAARALRQGHIDMAIVGGASYCSPDALVLFSQAQSVTAGQSCPFDAEADGLVTGEGYAAIVLKSLPRALADGDPIRGVIRGIGVSSDGRGKSLWAPRKEGQILAIRRAYAAGVDIARLQYVEAHATSTQAGDTVEMTALVAALEGQLPTTTKIPIGSVKANIGHTLETAGLAGLVKTVLAMEHGVIPRQIHLRTLNPNIDWQHAPFFVPTENLVWHAPADGHPRRAAVNSFGIGGLNVHVVLDQCATAAETAASCGAGVSPASAAGTAAPQKSLRILCGEPSQGPPVAPDDQAIAIVGAGCVFPGARNLEAYWDLLISGRDPKCEVPPQRWNAALSYEAGAPRPGRSTGKLGGFITDFEYDWKRHKVPPKQIAGADPLQFMILDAADAALRDAGYDARPYDKQRTAAIVGTIFGSDFSNQLQMGLRLPEIQQVLAEVLGRGGISAEQARAVGEDYATLLLKRMPALLDEAGSFTPSSLASRITKSMDLMGGGATLNAGAASSLAAIAAAADMLASGDCDMVVCAAGCRALGLPVYERLSLFGTLPDGQPKAPFDAAADGFVPAEGVGVVLLKRLADARRDGDRIRGVIRGLGCGFAGKRQEALALAIRRALESGAAAAADVAMVETAAIGLPKQDCEEVRALAEIYGSGGRRQPLLLASIAAQLGEARGAMGMASLLKAALAMEHGQAPGTFGLSRPAPWLADHQDVLRVAAENGPLAAAEPAGRLLTAIDSCDGSLLALAYHLLLERGCTVVVQPSRLPAVGQAVPDMSVRQAQPDLRVAVAPAPPTWQIVRLGGPDWQRLADDAGRLAVEAESRFAAAAAREFTAADRFRLAIVACSPADLAERARLAAGRLAAGPGRLGLEPKGIYLGETAPKRPRVAFLFPGQGSQYVGMLQALVGELPAAAAAMRQLDDVLARLGFPSFADLAWADGDALGRDVWRTQLSVLLADSIVDASLRALGIEPDRISGHSYGEYPALLAAHAWTVETAIRATRVRCEAIEASRGSCGAMLSVLLAAPALEKICRALGGALYLANYNAPQQTVVGGSTPDIQRLAARLQAEGVTARVLAVPRPYHTPLMAETKLALRQGLEPLPIRPPRAPLLSSVTNGYVAEPAEIKANLVEQMTAPVRYVELIERLVGEGVGALVEVGPGGVLSGLHRAIVGPRPVAVLAADDRKQGGLRPLLAVRACL